MSNHTPLTPPDCDLRGLPFMPLDVVRLLDSDLFALSTGDEFKAAVSLWCKAWLQVPAASLPDDDRILAHLSGAGVRWSKVKGMALRGWIKCADGRLYHRAVAAKAIEAWAMRVAQRERAAKRWNKEKSGSGTPTAHAAASANAMPRHSHGSPGAYARDRDRDRDSTDSSLCSESGPQTDPDAETIIAAAEGAILEKPAQRGKRLPEDWLPSPDLRQFASDQGVDPDAVFPVFRDYWLGVPGEKGRKLDWDATFRNWCRREQRPAPRPAGSGGKPPSALAQQLERMQREYGSMAG